MRKLLPGALVGGFCSGLFTLVGVLGLMGRAMNHGWDGLGLIVNVLFNGVLGMVIAAVATRSSRPAQAAKFGAAASGAIYLVIFVEKFWWPGSNLASQMPLIGAILVSVGGSTMAAFMGAKIGKNSDGPHHKLARKLLVAAGVVGFYSSLFTFMGLLVLMGLSANHRVDILGLIIYALLNGALGAVIGAVAARFPKPSHAVCFSAVAAGALFLVVLVITIRRKKRTLENSMPMMVTFLVSVGAIALAAFLGAKAWKKKSDRTPPAPIINPPSEQNI